MGAKSYSRRVLEGWSKRHPTGEGGPHSGRLRAGHVPVATVVARVSDYVSVTLLPTLAVDEPHGAGPMDSEPHLDLSPPLMSSSSFGVNSRLPTPAGCSCPDGRRSAEVGRRRLVAVDSSLGLVPAPVAGAGPGGGPVL